jgi:hypothetical protein
MLAAVALALAVPWLTPLSFGAPAHGWQAGRSGTITTSVGRAHTATALSTAWTANVRCPDCTTANPPNATLQRLPRGGIIVWASIQPPAATGWPPDRRRLSRRYSLTDAYRFPCCEATAIGGGLWELYGSGPRGAYGVLVRVFWGSPPTAAMKAEAQAAIATLRLPDAR